MTRETFDMDKVNEIQTALKEAPPATGKLSKADVLRQLAPTLKELREDKGYTLEALVELLKTKGLDVKVSTLQGALKKKGTGTKRRLPSVPPPPSSPQTTPPPAATSAGSVVTTQDGVKSGDLTILGGKTKKTA